MITDNAIRAEILTQAVPYIKEYTGKYVVAKYGGNAMTAPVLKKNVMQDILLLHLIGVNVILVHGGGPDINAMLDALKIESHFENGLRVTDKDTMDVVQMVLAGKVNKGLVAYLSALGGKAIGLCGIDGNMIQVHTKDEKLGLVGEIEHIDTDVIDSALSAGFIPVISSVENLDEDDLVHILTEPKNALVKQYKRMFEIEGVNLEFQDDALREIAREAISRNTGARGLRAICEATLEETMFDIPSDLEITDVVVTPESVGGKQPPKIVRKSSSGFGKHTA